MANKEFMNYMIEFRHVFKTYPDGRDVLEDFCLEIKKGEIFVLLGKSGVGKTTAMKMINGLEQPSSGEVVVNGEKVQQTNIINLRRNVGFVPQGDSLFPHMTVKENIEVGRKLTQKEESEELSEVVEGLLEMLELDQEDLLSKYPEELSGGQKQRIVVARALASDPPILLMDEPFSAVDPLNRANIQKKFKRMQKKKEKTVLLVTHDLTEAVTMGDRVALIDEDRSLHINTPQNLLDDVNNEYLHQYFGEQRFHLVLQTKKISDVFPKGRKNTAKEKGQEALSKDESILKALSLFNKSPISEVYVEEDGNKGFSLTKPDLTKSIIDLVAKHVSPYD